MHAGQGILKAMVLAAGVGSRLEPLTTQLPKPLVPVANVPVMEHILNLLHDNGITDVCANLHYMPEQIKSYFGDGTNLGINLQFAYEGELSGDAGGVRACRQYLDGSTFIVLMGDLLTDADLTAVVAAHRQKRALATIGLKQVKDVSHFGVAVLDKNGFITGFQEKPQAEDALSNLASTGIYVLEPEVFAHIPATGQHGFGRQLFPQLVKNGLPVLGVEIDSYWSDVGTIAQYRSSNFDLLSRKIKLTIPGREEKRGAGVLWLEEGARVDASAKISGRALIGRRSIVQADVQLAGTVVVGADCLIETGAVLADCVIWDGAQVGAAAQLKDVVLGRNCRVAEGANQDGVALVPENLSAAFP